MQSRNRRFGSALHPPRHRFSEFLSVAMATPIESMLKEISVSVFVGLKVIHLFDLYSEMTGMIPIDDILHISTK